MLDVNNNPANPVIGVRSFGEDPHLVADMGAALIHGLQEHGMMATGKHFPGHGDTDENSHLTVTTIHASRARLDTVELVPFRRAIAAGVQGIMTFHGLVPALDTASVPATLNPAIMTGLLRRQLGFKGLLITDAMDMNGVLARVTVGQAANRGGQAVDRELRNDQQQHRYRRSVQTRDRRRRRHPAHAERRARRHRRGCRRRA